MTFRRRFCEEKFSIIPIHKKFTKNIVQIHLRWCIIEIVRKGKIKEKKKV